MNERRMGLTILILLIVLNLLLFGYYCYQRFTTNRVPVERIEQIRALYEEKGIGLPEKINRSNASKPYLILGEADLDQLVETFLNESYDKSYIYGSKVQYTSGNITILTDRANHTITYEDEAKMAEDEKAGIWSIDEAMPGEQQWNEEEIKEAEPVAEEFVKRWLGKDVYLAKAEKSKKGLQFVFYQIDDGVILYFNQIELYMTSEGVAEAVITYWMIEGESEKSYEMMPIDEILFAQLGNIKEDMKSDREEVVQIMDGYQLQPSGNVMEAIPTVTIVVSSGEEYRMKRTLT